MCRPTHQVARARGFLALLPGTPAGFAGDFVNDIGPVFDARTAWMFIIMPGVYEGFVVLKDMKRVEVRLVWLGFASNLQV